MKCEICDNREAVHTILGWGVCSSGHCKFIAWQWTPKEPSGAGDAGDNPGTKPAIPATSGAVVEGCEYSEE